MTDEIQKTTRTRYVVALVRDHWHVWGYGCVDRDPMKFTKNRMDHEDVAYIEPFDYSLHFKGGCGVEHRTIEAARRCRRKIATSR